MPEMNLHSGYWDFPVPIYYGPGSIRLLPKLVLQHGINRPLLVSDEATARLPIVQAMVAQLQAATIEVTSHSDFSANPTDEECHTGAKRLLEAGCDGIIAVGGGSSMDAAKAIGLIANQKQVTLWDFDTEVPPPDARSLAPFVPLVCVPTTSGTGAETEGTAMVVNTHNFEKRCIYHLDYHPIFALLDAELTLGLPRNLTSWTGIDAIVHAIEAYLVPGFHPLCDGAALQSLRLTAMALPKVVNNGHDLSARNDMQIGACLAGVAFKKGLGMVHAISHMVGGLYNTQHGLTNAVLLPAVLRFNESHMGNKAVELARACGADSDDFEGLYAWVITQLEALDIPNGLAALGVQSGDVERLASMAMNDGGMPTNPRPVSLAECQLFIADAMAKTW